MSKENSVSILISEDLGVYCDNTYGEEYGDLFRNKLSKDLDYILSSCKHNRDRRSNLEYGKELILGWILEDYIINLLENKEEVNVSKTGSDAQRQLLSKNKVSSTPDLQLKVRNKLVDVEIIVDFGGEHKRHI